MKFATAKKSHIFVLAMLFASALCLLGGIFATQKTVSASATLTSITATAVAPNGTQIAFDETSVNSCGWTVLERDGDRNATKIKKNIFIGNRLGNLPNPIKGYDADYWQDNDMQIDENTLILTTQAKTLVLHTTYHNFSITYKDCVDATNPNPMTYTIANSVNLKNASKTGYTFLGWTDSKNLLATKNITIDFATYGGDVTETAKWQANEYSINFDANGGVGAMNQQVCTYGKTYALSQMAFLRAGFNFLGWSRSSTATKAEFCDEAMFSNLTAQNNGIVNLYAVWTTQNVYCIKFNANGTGASGAMNNQPCEYSKTQSLYANAFSRRGYTFESWNTEQDGSGQTYQDGQEISNLTSTNGAVVNLYAIWSENSYTIKFDSSGQNGSMEPQIVKYSEFTKLAKNRFESAEYEFVGWSLMPNGNTNFVDEQVVSKLADGGEVTLYAVWQNKTATSPIISIAVIGGCLLVIGGAVAFIVFKIKRRD